MENVSSNKVFTVKIQKFFLSTSWVECVLQRRDDIFDDEIYEDLSMFAPRVNVHLLLKWLRELIYLQDNVTSEKKLEKVRS